MISRSRKLLAKAPHDYYLIVTVIALIGFGLLMMTSASIDLSERLYGQAFHFLFRQSIYLLLGLVMAYFIVQIDSKFWQQISPSLLIFGFLLLVIVLIPGIGHEVNGSRRWLGLAGVGLQISELIKLIAILYLAGYLVRRQDEVRERASGFMKPMLVLLVIAALLLKEPDFGAAFVIMVTALGMMFLARVKLSQFILLLVIVVIGLAVIAVASPYRLARITSFVDPWEHAFGSGYQLTQSLIAFGRGGWFGVGLGGSVQKLFYLPEAHTDFIFAVMGEELGLIGLLVLIGLFVLFVVRGLKIARMAQNQGRDFAAYVAYGIAFWVALQVMINIGVSTGILPTKGLTLPFVSYGGSSLVVMLLALAILLRIDHENRLQLKP